MYCTEHCTYDLIPGTLLGAHGTAESSAPTVTAVSRAIYLAVTGNTGFVETVTGMSWNCLSYFWRRHGYMKCTA